MGVLYIYLLPFTETSKVKAIPFLVWTNFQEGEASRIYRQLTDKGGKVVSPTGRSPGTYFCYKLS